MRYQIVDAKLSHIRAIAPKLREGDRKEVEATGMAPRHLLHKLWASSFMRRAAIVDGEIAAVWGCGGALASAEGEAWLLTAPAIERIPVAFLKEMRANLREMLETKSTIVSSVLSSYTKSVRFMRIVGFTVGAGHEVGNFTFLELRMER